jgi:hypothetical protein
LTPRESLPVSTPLLDIYCRLVRMTSKSEEPARREKSTRRLFSPRPILCNIRPDVQINFAIASSLFQDATFRWKSGKIENTINAALSSLTYETISPIAFRKWSRNNGGLRSKKAIRWHAHLGLLIVYPARLHRLVLHHRGPMSVPLAVPSERPIFKRFGSFS